MNCIEIFSRRKYITPLYYSFGNAAEEILWAVAMAKSKGNTIKILPPFKFTEILSYKICNKELFRINVGEEAPAQSYQWFIRVFINILFFATRTFSLIFKKFRFQVKEKYLFPAYGKRYYWPYPEINKYGIKYAKNDLVLQSIHADLEIGLTNEQKNNSKEAITKLGLAGKKYVCLHVRDAGFHNDVSKRPYRNADVRSYVAAVEYLIKEGMVVVRLGDASMNRMGIDHPMYIEYSHSNFKSEVLDLCLVENCQFYIGMQSGPLDVALMFQKPVLILNMYEWIYGLPLKKIDRGLLKAIKLSEYGQHLSLRERFELPFMYTNPMNRLESNQLLFIDNSTEEIAKAVKDFYEDYCSGFTSELSGHLQKNRILFEKYSEKHLSELVKENNTIFYPDQFELTRLIYKNLACQGVYIN